MANGREQRSEEVQRWTAKRRAALVISLLKGETTAAEAARAAWAEGGGVMLPHTPP